MRVGEIPWLMQTWFSELVGGKLGLDALALASLEDRELFLAIDLEPEMMDGKSRSIFGV
jgi:hypothetical protein